MSEPTDRPDPEPVRALVTGITTAVEAARAGDRDSFDAAVAELNRGGARRPDAEQVGVVVGLLLGELFERVHPDGIDSDDAELVVERCLRTYRPWWPPLDEDQLIRALAGALRIDTYAGPDAVTVTVSCEGFGDDPRVVDLRTHEVVDPAPEIVSPLEGYGVRWLRVRRAGDLAVP